MGLFNKKENFPWVDLQSWSQFLELFENNSTFLLFKHSTRCVISSMVKRNFETEIDKKDDHQFLYLDLLQHRDISNQVGEYTGVYHQSPQVILIKNKEVIYSASHEQISPQQINALLNNEK